MKSTVIYWTVAVCAIFPWSAVPAAAAPFSATSVAEPAPSRPVPARVYPIPEDALLTGPQLDLLDGARQGFDLTGSGDTGDLYVTVTASEPNNTLGWTLTMELPGPSGPIPYRAVALAIGEGVEAPGGILVLADATATSATVILATLDLVATLIPTER